MIRYAAGDVALRLEIAGHGIAVGTRGAGTLDPKPGGIIWNKEGGHHRPIVSGGHHNIRHLALTDGLVEEFLPELVELATRNTRGLAGHEDGDGAEMPADPAKAVEQSQAAQAERIVEEVPRHQPAADQELQWHRDDCCRWEQKLNRKQNQHERAAKN